MSTPAAADEKIKSDGTDESPSPEETAAAAAAAEATTMSKFISDNVIIPLLDPDLDVSIKLKKAKDIKPYLEDIDGYWSFSSVASSSSGPNASTARRTSTMEALTLSSQAGGGGGNITEGQLPIMEWNTHFRKSYTILLWVRPNISNVEKETTIAEDDLIKSINSSSGTNSKTKRILYRFANHNDDSKSQTGVCVTVGDWRAIQEEEDDDDEESEEEEKEDNDDEGGENSTKKEKKKKRRKKKKNRKLITTLTAYSLPYEPPDMDAMLRSSSGHHGNPMDEDFNPAPFVTAPLELMENEWAFIGITHVHPYLKRPHWSICVNGKTIAAGELFYPQFDHIDSGNNRGRGRHNANEDGIMNYNTLFRNVTYGGCELIRTRKNDCAKNASELQSNTDNYVNPRYELKLHVASFCVAANEVFTPTIQALLSQAGPTMTIQSYGGLPQLPPVANWSKGSSLEGPNVGIPLVVHGQSLRVQQLSSSCVLWGTALESRLMHGRKTSSQTQYSYRQQQIVCRMPIQRGTTSSAPRVGLIQPTPPVQHDTAGLRNELNTGVGGTGWGEDIISHDNGNNMDGDAEAPISMTIVGNGCSVHHNLSNYLIDNPTNNVDVHKLHDTTTKQFSLLVLQSQNFDSNCCILPFFLSLPPPGTMYELQLDTLLTKSLQQLFDLFSNSAAYGSELIGLLTTTIRYTGGGRWHEELLQNGTIHVLVSSLRQALVRAEFLNVSKYSTYTDFIKAQAVATTTAAPHGGTMIQRTYSRDNSSSDHQPNVNPMTVPMTLLPISPTQIPLSIVQAMIDVLDSCCGPPLSITARTTTSSSGTNSNNTSTSRSSSSVGGRNSVDGYVEDLDPSVQIQRTSDLALSAVFGMALDMDLWGCDLRAAAMMWYALSTRYGGICITSGYILRSQISVQYFLDVLKSMMMKSTNNYGNASNNNSSANGVDNDSSNRSLNTGDKNNTAIGGGNEGDVLKRRREQKYLRSIGVSAGEMLKSMLLSSLSNQRSISQGEHDVSACLGTLSDSPLGSLVSHVVLYALVGILEWCEIVPPNFLSEINYPTEPLPSAPSTLDDEDDDGDDGDDSSVCASSSSNNNNNVQTTPPRHHRRHSSRRIDDDHKCQVASRLARNLMMGQYHNVISPMLLSRTIFAGYSSSSSKNSSGTGAHNLRSSNTSANSQRSVSSSASASNISSKHKKQNSDDVDDNDDDDDGVSSSLLLPLSWEEDWRLALSIFVWVSSISGNEGIVVSKSLGSLLLASGLAGSIHGILENIVDGSWYMKNLFVPDPTMACTVVAMRGGSSSLSDGWSYTDLLADRLAVLIPMIPSFVISMFDQNNNNNNNSNSNSGDGCKNDTNDAMIVSERSVEMLTELITNIGGSFYRVFGGVIHSSSSHSASHPSLIEEIINGGPQQLQQSLETNTATAYVPHLIAVTMILEELLIKMRRRSSSSTTAKSDDGDDDDTATATTTILHAPALMVQLKQQKGNDNNDNGSWVEVPSSTPFSGRASSFSDNFTVTMPPPPPPKKGKIKRQRGCHTNKSLSSVVENCQQSLLTTISESMYSAMKVGGGETSTILWRSVLRTLKEVESYAMYQSSSSSSSPSSSRSIGDDSTIATTTTTKSNDQDDSEHNNDGDEATTKNTNENTTTIKKDEEEALNFTSKSVLCRLISMVLIKCLERDYSWELWSIKLSCAITRLCLLIEEKELLLFPLITANDAADSATHSRSYSNDQIILMCTLRHVLEYGRDTTGWCQLILPTPPTGSSNDDDDKGNGKGGKFRGFFGRGKRDGASSSPSTETPLTSKAAKIMLPILQPTLRVMLDCMGSCNLKSGSISVAIPKSKTVTAGETAVTSTSTTKLSTPSSSFDSGDETKHDEKIKTDDGKADNDPQQQQQQKEQPLSEDDSTVIVDLLEYTAKELRHSLMAAIVGLAFATARDIALHAMATFRRSIQSYQTLNDEKGVELCESLLCMTAEEIRVRYEGERRRRETALIDAYNNSDEFALDASGEAAAAGAAADSSAVENLILGDDIVPGSTTDDNNADPTMKNSIEKVLFVEEEKAAIAAAKDGGRIYDDGGDGALSTSNHAAAADFLLFSEGLTAGSTGVGISSSSTINRAKMEWSKYDGLCVALEKCSVQGSNDDGGDGSTKKPIDHESKDVKLSSSLVLTTLEPFLNAWDEHAAVDAVDTELVKLFDFHLSFSKTDLSNVGGESNAIPELDVFCLQGSGETAADAMSTFIELAAAEKSRLMEVTDMFLPNHRNSCIAFTDRFCWSRYMEILRKCNKNGVIADLWERGISDGNRDVRSRLVSIPCSPQFKRFIPKYLDHSTEAFPVGENDGDIQTSGKSSTGNDNEINDIDAFTSLLIESGQLEIFDITKKEINEEEEPKLDLVPGALDDDFDDSPLEISTARPDNDRRNDVSPKKKGDKKSDENNETVTDETTTTATEGSDGFSKDETAESFDKTKIGASHFNITASAFASPPDNSSSTLGLMHSAAAGLIERHLENCLHVKTEGSRKCSMLLTSTHLILEYDVDCEGLYEGELMAVHEEAERQRMIEETTRTGSVDEDKIRDIIEKRQKMAAALRPKSIRWNLSELSHVYLRRYRLRDSSIELFFIPSGGTSFGGYGLYSPSTSLFLDFGPGYEGTSRRDDAAFAIMRRAPPQAIKQWPDRAAQFMHEQLSRLTIGWVEGRITNFDYLLHLNMLSGRSYNDTCQYPIMPWVLSNYHSDDIPDLTDPKNFRDLTKPMGALNPNRLEDFIERFNTFADPTIPPFMYGSHYSTNAGVVLHFLVRLHPFAGLHRQLQGGHFDVADRLFASVPRTWEMCTGSSAAEVKELTPEWYCNPSFLKNANKFKLGTSQDGDVIEDVQLPPWAKGSAEKFIEVMRNALESDICSSMIPDWIDLVFGRKQQGPEAIAAHNVFFYLTYYGSVDVAAIEDDGLRQATELQIAHFGQCPMQLFVRPHVRRVQYVNKKRLSFYQITSAYTFGIDRGSRAGDETPVANPKSVIFGQPLYLPFFSAPISHWVHLDAPPPGPHAPLICVRLAGTDRCLAVDGQGVFHCFRWVWKAGESTEITGFNSDTKFPLDNGCFIAQRELTRFRTVPRLVFKPQRNEYPAVAISKTLFAGRSVLLVLSDGDGRGGLAMQLVDPAEGLVRGEAVIKSIHSARILCIATDPIGTAAGHGGVGGELAIVGSVDGTASIWRFMSSHYLPLRPRVRLSGHCSSAIHAVGLNAAINIAATVSRDRLCLHSTGNGTVIRIIEPPKDTLELPDDVGMTTTFANSPAVAISVQGFVVAVCETRLKSNANKSIITLHLFSLEGVSLGSKALDSWRGVPYKIFATPDGTTILVCCGRGITVHRLSAVTPLEFIDEWQVTESEELSSNNARAFDIDLGPSLNRPVVAAAACSNGALRLHGLAGISAFSERHKKVGISQKVGSNMAAAAGRFRGMFGRATAVGNKAADVGKDVTKEISSEVKERGVTGFLGGMFGRK